MKNKRPTKLIIFGVLVLLFFGYLFTRPEPVPQYEYVVAEKVDLIEEVSVSGRVNPAESLELSLERSGRITSVRADVGDQIEAGEAIVVLDQTELLAQRAAAQATVDAGLARLAELKRGARPEEVSSAQTKVVNAESALQDAQTQYLLTQEKNDADLDAVYSATVNKMKEAVVAAKGSLVDLTQMQQAHYTGISTQEGYAIADAKAAAIFELFGEPDAGNWIAGYISDLESGLFESVQSLTGTESGDTISGLLNDTISAVGAVHTALESVPVDDKLSTTEKTTLSMDKTAMTGQSSLLQVQKQALSVQEAAANSALALAESQVTVAENALLQVTDALILINSGNTSEAIAAQEAAVRSARAQVSLINAQLSQMVLRSPIDGVVTNQEAMVGETAAAYQPLVSIMSKEGFEIELFVAEADIAKVSLGDMARVTLDAFGEDEVFEAQVSFIDPAEVIKAGVPAYKVTLLFIDTKDLVRSGMTANTDIITDSREDVLAVRSRSIVTNDDGKFVRILRSEGVYEEVPVEVGLKSSQGLTEILKGVNEGDKVITFIPK